MFYFILLKILNCYCESKEPTIIDILHQVIIFLKGIVVSAVCVDDGNDPWSGNCLLQCKTICEGMTKPETTTTVLAGIFM